MNDDDLYTEANFLHLADLYDNITAEYIHPAAYAHRHQIAARLREYAKNPAAEEAQLKYNKWAFLMPGAIFPI